jgi:putative addiction module component (TIGR02574 family)
MIAETIPQIQGLTPREKLILVGELLEQFEEAPQDTPQNEAIVRLLDARMADYEKNPDSAISWEDFKKKTGIASHD